MNTFGLEIVLPIPILSNAVISAFKTPEPVRLKIPIPLVGFVIAKFAKLSVASPRLAAPPGSVPKALPALPPDSPPATLPAL